MRQTVAITVGVVLIVGTTPAADTMRMPRCSSRPRVSVRVALAAASTSETTLKDHVRDEITAIWSRQGVSLDWLNADTLGAAAQDVLRIVLQEEPLARGSATPAIAWIGFVAGRPRRIVRASTQAAHDLLTRELWRDQRGLHSDQLLHLDLYQTLCTRLIGWAVAHEIGHFLLMSAAHDATGLMRPSFRASELLKPRPEFVTLADSSARRLALRIEPCLGQEQ